jgi:hypothetical protein
MRCEACLVSIREVKVGCAWGVHGVFAGETGRASKRAGFDACMHFMAGCSGVLSDECMACFTACLFYLYLMCDIKLLLAGVS